MKAIGSILTRKGGQIWSVAPGDTMLQAITRMAERGVGALLVMEGPALVGIISERDYARRVILEGRRSADTRVDEIMSRNVITVTTDVTVEQGLALMTERFIRHLPVVENDRVIGVVSIGDLVKEVIKDQRFEIEELRRYVSG